MAGGTFQAHNKIRPGAYINFKAVTQPKTNLGTRGVVTLPVALGWGAEITELYSTELLDGKSLVKVGFTAMSEEGLFVREALKNAYKAIVYRLDTGGDKATAAIAPLTATAKYAGVVGNKLSIAVIANGESFDVITMYDGAEVDKQTSKTADALVDNDWVEFGGEGNLAANAGVNLTEGANGTVSSQNYTTYLDKIAAYKWDTMAIPYNEPSVNTAVVTFIKKQREELGKKVQAVLYNSDADYEGIISLAQGYKTENETVSPEAFTAYFAGLTAGSSVNVSNTYHVIENALSIVYPSGVSPYTEEVIIEKLKAGKLVLSTRQDGAVVVEQDINTLHTFDDKNKSFSKNRVIRTLDEISNTIAFTFERSYIGKVTNDEDGRNIFKSDIISYLNTLQEMSAIRDFNSSTDIQVYAGTDIDTVVADLAIWPVDSMEKLYLTVVVG